MKESGVWKGGGVYFLLLLLNEKKILKGSSNL